MIQHMKTTPFQTGKSTQDIDKDSDRDESEKVRKVTSASRMKNSGIKDGLHKAMATVKSGIPSGNDKWTHTSRVKARGADYHPMGQEGPMQRTGAGHGVYSYGSNVYSAAPANAVGTYPNRKGQNAIGSPPNRHGANANPGPRVPNRAGVNAIGNPPNRFGANALASDFRPRFKGGPASRRA